MKTCAMCKSPAKCKAAGKCLAKPVKKKMGGSFPDLTGDGKVTKADVLKGRGVKTAKQGGVMKYSKAGKVRGAGMANKGSRPCKMR